jgi:phosphonate transport system substrate-binding protein
MRLKTRAAAFVLLFLALGVHPFSGGEKGITLALIPDGLSTQERAPLQDYLTHEMGTDVRLMTPESYTAAVDGLNSGSIDFACLGALTYVRAHAKIGVVPLVQRTADLQFHSVFIAGTATKIHSLSDLKGKKFAFGDINSASAHLMPYLELKQAGIDPNKDLEFRYSGGHPLTVKLVEAGVVDAGVTDETVYHSMVSSGKIDGKKVRIFYTSKPYVDYVYVARKGLPEAERDRFVSAMLSMKQGKDDSALKVLRASKFVKATDDEYGTLRQIARELKMF